ncbi:hypothetical protein V8E51_001959 [Hyaloscypha variabilis]
MLTWRIVVWILHSFRANAPEWSCIFQVSNTKSSSPFIDLSLHIYCIAEHSVSGGFRGNLQIGEPRRAIFGPRRESRQRRHRILS